jgi:hypothetical protein
MDKKELILTVAKDLLVGYKFLPPERERGDVKSTVDSVADLFAQMTKRVETIYKEIGE